MLYLLPVDAAVQSLGPPFARFDHQTGALRRNTVDLRYRSLVGMLNVGVVANVGRDIQDFVGLEIDLGLARTGVVITKPANVPH
jgi:hypothetical protein